MTELAAQKQTPRPFRSAALQRYAYDDQRCRADGPKLVP
jgi:hypothetical protein